jgi:hypothetical protein
VYSAAAFDSTKLNWCLQADALTGGVAAGLSPLGEFQLDLAIVFLVQETLSWWRRTL